jgi:hypothetical protein
MHSFSLSLSLYLSIYLSIYLFLFLHTPTLSIYLSIYFSLSLYLSLHPHSLTHSSYLTLGNVVAVGTFEPEIEIWDLDVLEILQPLITLGGRDEQGKFKPGSHHQAVMSLSWNRHAR